jgi:hypothetical protein
MKETAELCLAYETEFPKEAKLKLILSLFLYDITLSQTHFRQIDGRERSFQKLSFNLKGIHHHHQFAKNPLNSQYAIRYLIRTALKEFKWKETSEFGMLIIGILSINYLDYTLVLYCFHYFHGVFCTRK